MFSPVCHFTIIPPSVVQTGEDEEAAEEAHAEAAKVKGVVLNRAQLPEFCQPHDLVLRRPEDLILFQDTEG